MRRSRLLRFSAMLLAAMALPLIGAETAGATATAGETFAGVSTHANQWMSGGSVAISLFSLIAGSLLMLGALAPMHRFYDR